MCDSEYNCLYCMQDEDLTCTRFYDHINMKFFDYDGDIFAEKDHEKMYSSNLKVLDFKKKGDEGVIYPVFVAKYGYEGKYSKPDLRDIKELSFITEDPLTGYIKTTEKLIRYLPVIDDFKKESFKSSQCEVFLASQKLLFFWNVEKEEELYIDHPATTADCLEKCNSNIIDAKEGVTDPTILFREQCNESITEMNSEDERTISATTVSDENVPTDSEIPVLTYVYQISDDFREMCRSNSEENLITENVHLITESFDCHEDHNDDTRIKYENRDTSVDPTLQTVKMAVDNEADNSTITLNNAVQISDFIATPSMICADDSKYFQYSTIKYKKDLYTKYNDIQKESMLHLKNADNHIVNGTYELKSQFATPTNSKTKTLECITNLSDNNENCNSLYDNTNQCTVPDAQIHDNEDKKMGGTFIFKSGTKDFQFKAFNNDYKKNVTMKPKKKSKNAADNGSNSTMEFDCESVSPIIDSFFNTTPVENRNSDFDGKISHKIGSTSKKSTPTSRIPSRYSTSATIDFATDGTTQRKKPARYSDYAIPKNHASSKISITRPSTITSPPPHYPSYTHQPIPYHPLTVTNKSPI